MLLRGTQRIWNPLETHNTNQVEVKLNEPILVLTQFNIMQFEKLDWTELMSVHSKINFIKLKMGISNFIQLTHN